MSMNDTLQNSLTNFNTSTIIVENLFHKIILGCVLSSLAIFTVCGNILVLYAIQTEKYLRTVSNLFILSLAVADLAVGLFVMPLSAATIIVGRWPFSSLLCKIWLSADYVASTASIFNLVLLSLDRYWAVVYPLRYLRKRTRRRASKFILFVWFISFLWAPAVIFWSNIAPKHSDIIKKDECDTAFRSNKTFKTLTALVNFYLPLLTMIIISCRIMIAIRSRSKMELGRRLSSSTQKQMKKPRAYTLTPLRNDDQPNTKSNESNGPVSSSPTIVANPFDLSVEKSQRICHNDNIIPLAEPGECFCSTCHPYDENDNDSLWQLQQTPLKKSYSSSLQQRLSFAQIKPISMIFLSNKSNKDLSKTLSPNYDTTVKNSLSVSNNMKYPSARNSFEYLEKERSSTIKTKRTYKRSASRTSSIESSFSDDYSPTPFIDPIKSPIKEKLSKQESLTSNYSPPISPNLKLSPTTKEKLSITTANNNDTTKNSLLNSPTKMNFSTFFNKLINPSQSSSLQKELKAARQLGILVGVFTVSWLPYFILFLVVAWCNHCVSDTVYLASIWLGYLNSTFNPLIYPLCNVHFRRAFLNICYCRNAKTKLPNLNALRELHTLRAMSRRR